MEILNCLDSMSSIELILLGQFSELLFICIGGLISYFLFFRRH